MYTQCPNCETLYEVSSADLGAAQGRVRCSFCETTFNALRTLTESPRSPVYTAPALPEAVSAVPDDTPTIPPELEDGWPAGDEAQTPEPGSEHEDAEPEASAESGGSVESEASVEPEASDAEEADTVPPEVLAASIAQETAPSPAPTASEAVEDTPEEALRDARDLQNYLLEHPRRWKGVAWGLGVPLLLAALTAQILHHERERLVRHRWLGPKLTEVYSRFGVTLDQSYEPQHYRFVRGPDVSSQPLGEARAALRVYAVLKNTAARAQPHPEIRLTLSDRWGTAVASRTFEPAEYLDAQQEPTTLLAPGQTARLALEVLDPGDETVNFEIDICVRDSTGTLRCRDDVAR